MIQGVATSQLASADSGQSEWIYIAMLHIVNVDIGMLRTEYYYICSLLWFE